MTEYLQGIYADDIAPVFFPPPANLSDPQLDRHITINELINSINKCENRKTPGPDGISFEFFKNLPSCWLYYILDLFNKILDNESVPPDWGKIIITMIPKAGNLLLPDNYRGIALINSLTKIFTQLIKNRLMDWSEKNNLIPEFQSGFRNKRSCADNIFILWHLPTISF